MAKYTITIPDEIDEIICQHAISHGVSPNNLLNHLIITTYSPDKQQTMTVAQLLQAIENDLEKILTDLTDDKSYTFFLRDLPSMKAITSSTYKAAIGKSFYARVLSPSAPYNGIYKHIRLKGTRQRIAYYELTKEKGE